MDDRISQPKLTDKTFAQGLSELTMRDPDLAAAISKWGNPPFWRREPGFSAIVLVILSQQVSLESAQATFEKLESVVGSLSSESFLALDDKALRDTGFTRQKASYIRGLAQHIIDGEFDIEELASMDDDQARKRLMAVRGIGTWTADTYLLIALRRPDVWPSGDLALAKAIQALKRRNSVPDGEKAHSIANQWRPWRAVAARSLWHYYLNERGRASSALNDHWS